VSRPSANGGAEAGQTMAGAMQLAIGLLAASLDSPELERVGGGRANSARRGWPGWLHGRLARGLRAAAERAAWGDGRAVGGHLAKGWRSWRSTGGGHPPPAGAAPLPYHCRLPHTWHEVI